MRSRHSRTGTSRFTRVGVIPRVVFEPSIIEVAHPVSYVRRHAKRMRIRPTAAERELCSILGSLKGGVLKGRFTKQHVVSGRWIVDFFFPEIRLAIEVDGAIHCTAEQRARD